MVIQRAKYFITYLILSVVALFSPKVANDTAFHVSCINKREAKEDFTTNSLIKEFDNFLFRGKRDFDIITGRLPKDPEDYIELRVIKLKALQQVVFTCIIEDPYEGTSFDSDIIKAVADLMTKYKEQANGSRY